MSLRTLNAEDAAGLDRDLMSVGAFSLDQLMELAGLSVSQAVYQVHPPENGKRVLVAVGPGNNGGDGLVAARHLWHYGYQPTIYYPKQPKNELYQRLSEQLKNLGVPFTDDFDEALKTTDHVVDSIFGFSFSGEVREPFAAVITALENTKVPVTAVDAPSSWSIEDGPPNTGPGAKYNPQFLISLTAPKPLVSHFKGKHFVGGRFLPPSVAEKYNLDIPEYKGVDQIVELPAGQNTKTHFANYSGMNSDDVEWTYEVCCLEKKDGSWRVNKDDNLHEGSSRVAKRELFPMHNACWRILEACWDNSSAIIPLDLTILADFFISQPRRWQRPYMVDGNWVSAVHFTTGDYTMYRDPDEVTAFEKGLDVIHLQEANPHLKRKPHSLLVCEKPDCFSVLPVELRLKILCFLPSKVVGDIRQVSAGMASVPLEGTFWLSRLSEPDHCHLPRDIVHSFHTVRTYPGQVPQWLLALQQVKKHGNNRQRIIGYSKTLVEKMLQRQKYLKKGKNPHTAWHNLRIL
ncbi:MAG: hypothetical protein Q9172_002218 [Xanthocarpia lactea]